MKSAILCVLIVCLSLVSFAQEASVIRYEGSSTIAHFIRDAETVYGQATFIVDSESESSGGELSILDGSADIGGVARTPSPQVLGNGVTSTLIGWDAIALVVNASNPVTDLSKEELKGIFTGKTKNWSELGGRDLAIKPYIVDARSATRNVFRASVLWDEDYAGCETIVPDQDILERVASEAGGIGQISFSFLSMASDQVKTLIINGQNASVGNQSYPITRPLYLLTWPANASATAFAEWTQSREGQEVVRKRFIGKSPQSTERGGKLIVYSDTYPVEEGGAYYYPHEGYEIYDSEEKLLRYVRNHLANTDENPSVVVLPPGQYLVWTESAKKNGQQKYLVTIAAGQTSRISMDSEDGQQVLSEVKETSLSDRLQFHGDFRFRGEQDWDSRRSNGTYRDDRGRLRYRLRLAFNYQYNKEVSFGARMRSGDPSNEQGPHNTLGQNPVGNGVSLDRAYCRADLKKWWFWVGKNNLPFWKQNEMWWDDDVNPEGIAIGSKAKLSESIVLRPTAGYFLMRSLGGGLEADPSLMAIQAALIVNQPKTRFTLASGLYSYSDIENRSASAEGIQLDYQLLISSAQVRFNTKMPIKIGIDHMMNMSNYSDQAEVVATGLQDEKEGYVGSIEIGELSSKGKILFAYFYAHVPKYSVVPHLSQDDWVRWSFNDYPGTRSSNFGGHELRVAYALGKGFNIVARAYFVEMLEREVPTDQSVESANRFRLDLNLNF